MFEDIDPNELISNKFEVTMMQENVRYFGDKAAIVSRKADSLQNNAEIISTDIVKRQTSDGSKDIHVTVKNTGTTAWRKNTNDRLVIWTNGSDKTKKVDLPDNITVMPGEKYTFTLKKFAVPQDKNTYYEFQMIQENVDYFGEKERVYVVPNS